MVPALWLSSSYSRKAEINESSIFEHAAVDVNGFAALRLVDLVSIPPSGHPSFSLEATLVAAYLYSGFHPAFGPPLIQTRH